MQRFLLWWEHRIATGTPRLGFRTRPQMEPSWKRRPRLHHVWGRTHLCIVLFGRNDEPSVEGGPQIVREVKEEGRELRSAERRGGKGWVGTCRSGRLTDH